MVIYNTRFCMFKNLFKGIERVIFIKAISKTIIANLSTRIIVRYNLNDRPTNLLFGSIKSCYTGYVGDIEDPGNAFLYNLLRNMITYVWFTLISRHGKDKRLELLLDTSSPLTKEFGNNIRVIINDKLIEFIKLWREDNSKADILNSVILLHLLEANIVQQTDEKLHTVLASPQVLGELEKQKEIDLTIGYELYKLMELITTYLKTANFTEHMLLADNLVKLIIYDVLELE